MDVHEKLLQLLQERGWSKYQLAKYCGLSESTIANIYRRNTMPSVSTLETICDGFGITLAQFFSEGETVEMTPELRQVFVIWKSLTAQQKDALLQLMRTMNHAACADRKAEQ